jgi:hypothetical protein
VHQTTKKQYVRPTLKEHGIVRELTQVSSGGVGRGRGMSMGHEMSMGRGMSMGRRIGRGRERGHFIDL